MKIAILGTLKLTTNYRDWLTCFHRQLCKVPISEILITGGNTVLNRYAKHYAKSMAIPIKEYHINESSDYKSAKLIRNERIIRDADLVVACVDEYPLVHNCEVDKASVSNNRAIVINISNYIHQSTLINDMKEMEEVTREELITLEDELALIKQIRQSSDDCEAAKEKLLLVNRRFVRTIAKRYANEKYPVEELIIEGNKGLLHAVKRYDETKGYKFISYALYWIKESIKQYINKKKIEMDTHKFYKEKVESSLSKAIGCNVETGIWKYTRKDVFGNKETKIIPKGHILPLEDSCKSAAEKRAEAIEKYLGLKVAEFLGPKLKGLHQYSHHLNSSQTLCIQFFSALIEGNYPHFTAKQELVDLLKSIDITIHTGAECKFEYQEKDKEEYKFKVHNQYGKEVIEYEGTSFDFHIKDNDIEVFFEIKFTEDGFGKACKDKKHPENMERHKEKAEQYKKLLLNIPKHILSLKQEPSVDEILMNYQLFRNLIRVGENKYVVFITDEKNPSTEAEKDNFQKKYEKSKNVIFVTWQNILKFAISHYPHKLPFQFECFKLPQEHE